MLDVGDTDGLMLKHLGKTGLGFNLSPVADREHPLQRRSRPSSATRRACRSTTARFDVVLCFETLEHVESPAQLLEELARVCRPDGRVFISIPWVPRTFIHPRDPTQPRGHQHIIEFCRDDFGVAREPHAARGSSASRVCELLGRAATADRACGQAARPPAVTSSAACSHSFQFFELQPASA